MLDADTKRRIDTARDILVGKLPDPKSQVEQITIALIYKFMDDLDAESEELGGERRFFSGDFAKYGWARLMRSGLGGHETLNLYAEAIQRMPENPNIPTLFREIFKNAYLPYRDPETLRLFLKTIDEFSYDHSERLGDAFEYLLSVMGSQGDAGQFRTPRHIIDFIVEIIDPQKGEKILDPACGTAGFLISAYKHILAANQDADGNSTLTPDDRERIARSFVGYDISPDMVRLSLVNLYLHHFPDPQIHEYDTLTSEERWSEYAGVILANPPFMSPKGGIIPHTRFTVQSKRSEVLFVDYIHEHLTAQGRAGIIVPEGIIFQSQTAYKQLRKLLVEESLVAVISLPAGVFNPYSGVKTSILILDKGLAKHSSSVAFFKVENDGFGLGAQRREIAKNDLPQMQTEIAAYLGALRISAPVDDLMLTTGQIVPKEKIAAIGDYNLSGERYTHTDARSSSYPFVAISDVAEVVSGFGFPLVEQGKLDEEIPFLKVSDMNLPGNETFIVTWNNTVSRTVLKKLGAKAFPAGTIIFPKIGAAIATNKKRVLTTESTFDNNVMGIVPSEQILSAFLLELVRTIDISQWASSSSPPSMRKTTVEAHHIPLPPLDVQREIVAEIEGYQRVIDGARAVVENYRPHIPIGPDWPSVALKDVADLTNGYAFKSADMISSPVDSNYRPVVKIGNIGRDSRLHLADAQFHIYTEDLSRFDLHVGDIVIAMTGATVGKVAVVEEPGLLLNQRVGALRAKPCAYQPYLFLQLSSEAFYKYCQRTAGGGAQGNIAPREILEYRIFLPQFEEQQEIAGEIGTEQVIVEANRKLISRFEEKIQATLDRVWGNEPASTPSPAQKDLEQFVSA
ncbi:MAG: N-6 DNA methylase [Thermomicrobiales bacterium]